MPLPRIVVVMMRWWRHYEFRLSSHLDMILLATLLHSLLAVEWSAAVWRRWRGSEEEQHFAIYLRMRDAI